MTSEGTSISLQAVHGSVEKTQHEHRDWKFIFRFLVPIVIFFYDLFDLYTDYLSANEFLKGIPCDMEDIRISADGYGYALLTVGIIGGLAGILKFISIIRKRFRDSLTTSEIILGLIKYLGENCMTIWITTVAWDEFGPPTDIVMQSFFISIGALFIDSARYCSMFGTAITLCCAFIWVPTLIAGMVVFEGEGYTQTNAVSINGRVWVNGDISTLSSCTDYKVEPFLCNICALDWDLDDTEFYVSGQSSKDAIITQSYGECRVYHEPYRDDMYKWDCLDYPQNGTVICGTFCHW
eukprot:776148_1